MKEVETWRKIIRKRLMRRIEMLRGRIEEEEERGEEEEKN